MIQTKNIIKTYGSGDVETKVLKGVDLFIESGDFVAIIGPSGAGKSTLMYQMSLLDHPTSGLVIIDGVDATALSSDERTRFRLMYLGYVFQDYALMPELTALENIMVPMLMQGISTSAARQKSLRTLKKVGLENKSGSLPSQLSGGQQQRISIARAIAHDPKILFADEPTANLDHTTSRGVLDVFLELNQKGQTIIMVTHETEFAEKAHRVVELRDGNITSDTRMRKI